MNPSQPAGANKLFFGYENDEGTPWLDYSEGITGTTTGNYTYYVIPKTNRGNIFLGVSNGGGGYFECEIGSVTVEHILAAFQPMYSSVLNNATDYYAFGSPMPGRNYNSPNYRYGFNGQEKDDEVYGAGNLNTAEFWEYDTRLGRRWNMDPKPIFGISDYACFTNNPILLPDPNGDIVKHNNFRDRINTTKGRLFNKDFRSDYKQLKKSDQLYVFNGSKKHTVQGDASAIGEMTYNPENSSIIINYSYGVPKEGLGVRKLGTLFHETNHGVQFDDGKLGFVKGITGQWSVANNDMIDEYEGLNASYMHGKNDYYKADGGFGIKVNEVTNTKRWKDGTIEERLGYTNQLYKEYGNVQIQKVNAATVKNSNNYFRKYNPKSPNPSGSKIEIKDSTVPIELKTTPNNSGFDWNFGH